MYKPIKVDREKRTIMGVKFPDLMKLESTAYAIGSNMFEGFEPTPEFIELLRDNMIGTVSESEYMERLKSGLRKQ